ncbi:MAG TPA: hypothetical protein VF692_06730 [Pyrinomonadaceae bacterium]|jgi:hypothetical protein
MNSENVKVVIAIGKEKLTFRQQIINVGTEEKLRQQFTDLIGDEEKEVKTFDLNVEALVKHQAEKIERITLDGEGKEVAEQVDAKDYFAGKTGLKERFAEYAVRAWFASMSPSIDFF